MWNTSSLSDSTFNVKVAVYGVFFSGVIMFSDLENYLEKQTKQVPMSTV